MPARWRPLGNFLLFGAAFTAGLDVSIDDGKIVAGAGPGGNAQMIVYDATTFTVLNSLLAFGVPIPNAISVSYDDDVIAAGAGAGTFPQFFLHDAVNSGIIDGTLAFGVGFFGGIDVALGNGKDSWPQDLALCRRCSSTIKQTLELENTLLAFDPFFTGGVRVDIDDAAAVPEPALGMVLGLGLIAHLVRRRRSGRRGVTS